MRAGRIVAVGSRRDAFEAVSHGAVIYDLGGRTVMPGLVDTHTHLCATASWRRRVDCRDLYHSSIDSIDAILTSMRVAAEGKSPGELIAGTGSAMQEFRIKEKRLPTRRELDDAVPDHPAFIMFGAHITVANSRALRLVDINAATPDPPGGVIERDDKSEPTGVLRERAQRPLWMAEQPDSLEELKLSIRQELLSAAARGVTTIHEILDKPAELRALQELERERTAAHTS